MLGPEQRNALLSARSRVASDLVAARLIEACKSERFSLAAGLA